ncbi:beta-N-acetylglucosaminidase domain-containing protein [Streptomyces pathocidini]|uniref:beta-N-acetylhexosaminidase family protein n=1 Tax=Streptomyces pathocidini TaxID=1650571 RepID=UPI0033E97668
MAATTSPVALAQNSTAHTGTAPGSATASPALPIVTPRPQEMTANGGPLRVPSRVRVLLGEGADKPTRKLVVSVLRGAGARQVDVKPLAGAPERKVGELTVVVGRLGDATVTEALKQAGGSLPADAGAAEGYALAAKSGLLGGGSVVLAGADSDGTYYAAQTLRQLAGHRALAGVSVVDRPLMPLRGVIEGFYGSPWTHAERMDQLAFYGDVKMNTYIYAPKDDPYHREKWREPYPADKLAELGELVEQAQAHHVRFTFALSPGVSMCYSDAADLKALEAKLQAVYDLGVRSFSIPLDDISYTKWNCEGDQAKYGAPSQQAAAQAQVDLLNRVQKEFLEAKGGEAKPLQMVPTEYGDVKESPYKKKLRDELDPDVEVMWTGTDVVPPKITVEDAAKAAGVWGRKVFVWDNYPVNDYGQSEGRLLLAPYAEREPGLHEQLSGLVLNPMNQASASKVALFGGADFAWHDTGYDADRTWKAAADYLAGGDARTARALLAFFDTQHLAPTFGEHPWQPQAPELARRLTDFEAAWEAEDKARAVRELRPYAKLLAAAPEQIRDGVEDKGFAADSEPWLKALDLWAKALLLTLDGLDARLEHNEERSSQLFAKADELTKEAEKIQTIPGETRPEGPVRIADGILDKFIKNANALH